VSVKYSEQLAVAGIEPSVGSVGDSCDKAIAETTNGLYKAEEQYDAMLDESTMDA
jgi:transposase InsO family protein